MMPFSQFRGGFYVDSTYGASSLVLLIKTVDEKVPIFSGGKKRI